MNKRSNYIMGDFNPLFLISLQQTAFVYILKRRSNTQYQIKKITLWFNIGPTDLTPVVMLEIRDTLNLHGRVF